MRRHHFKPLQRGNHLGVISEFKASFFYSDRRCSIGQDLSGISFFQIGLAKLRVRWLAGKLPIRGSVCPRTDRQRPPMSHGTMGSHPARHRQKLSCRCPIVDGSQPKDGPDCSLESGQLLDGRTFLGFQALSCLWDRPVLNVSSNLTRLLPEHRTQIGFGGGPPTGHYVFLHISLLPSGTTTRMRAKFTWLCDSRAVVFRRNRHNPPSAHSPD